MVWGKNKMERAFDFKQQNVKRFFHARPTFMRNHFFHENSFLMRVRVWEEYFKEEIIVTSYFPFAAYLSALCCTWQREEIRLMF